MEEKQFNNVNKKKAVIIGAAISAIVIISIVVSLIYIKSPQQRLKKQLSLGETYLSELKFNDAILAFEAAIEIDSKCEQAYAGIIRAYIGLEDYESASKELDRAVKAVGETDSLADLRRQIAEYYIAQGNRYLQESDYINAITVYYTALNIERNIEEEYLGLGNSYIGTKEYEKALGSVEEGIEDLGETEELIKLREKITELMTPPKEEVPEEKTVEENREEEEPEPVSEEPEPEEPEQEEHPVTGGAGLVLADGTSIAPGGSLSLAQLQNANYVITEGNSVLFAAIAGQGWYNEAIEGGNWAYEATYSSGTVVPLSQYVSWFVADPSYDYLTIELALGSPAGQTFEYNYHITR